MAFREDKLGAVNEIMSGRNRKPSRRERDYLIESHLGLVRTIARRYGGRGESPEDLIQVGAIGLIRAAERFDRTRNVPFAAFAKPAIEGQIRRHLEERGGSLRIPRELQRMKPEFHRQRGRLAASMGRPPTTAELAAALGVEEAQIESFLIAERARQPTAALSEEEMEALSESALPPASEDRLLLAECARTLDERERRIVFLRFHADLTEEAIAKELGISQTHVSRLLSVALAKLRTELTATDAGGSLSGRHARIAKDVTSHHAQNGHGPKAEHGSQIRRSSQGAGPRPSNPEQGQNMASNRKARDTYSGRFLVRMPSALHEKLSLAAKHEGVSLNRLVTDILAAAVARAEAPVAARPGFDFGRRARHPGARRAAALVEPGRRARP